MKKTIESDKPLDAEMLVIGIFDTIKCAKESGASLRIELTKPEVLYLAEVIKEVTHIEIY